VEGDPYRFKQVLNNLMSNAVKYTKKGEVLIRASADCEESDSEDVCILKISVQDTGEGIPEGKMDLLFKVFTQSDPSNTRLYGGTGLGLAIAKNIVEHMDGKNLEEDANP
ncbi:MAG: ATP-binding protein, partial [bacterium]